MIHDKSHGPVIPRLLIVTAFLLWSTTGPLVRAAGLSVANFITIANVAGLGLLLVIFHRRIFAHVRTLPRGPVLRLCLGGAVNVWTSYIAFSYTSVGNVITFHYAAPIIVAVTAPLVLKEKPEARTLEALMLSILGLTLCAWKDVALGSSRDLIGIFLALCSACGYAVAILESRSVARSGCDPIAVVMVQGGFLSVISLPFVAWDTWPVAGCWMAAGAGILHLAIAAGLYLVGLARVPAPSAAAFGYTEIVFAMAWGAWLFAEPVTLLKALGAVAIIAGGILLVRSPAGDLTLKNPS